MKAFCIAISSLFRDLEIFAGSLFRDLEIFAISVCLHHRKNAICLHLRKNAIVWVSCILLILDS